MFCLLEIDCITPVTSCICERSFSAMRRLHAVQHGSGSAKFPCNDAYSLWYIDIVTDDVIDNFGRKQPRRLQFQSIFDA